MKEIRFRLFLVIGAFALSLYLLYPTYQDYKNNVDVSETLVHLEDSLKESSPNLTPTEIRELITAKKDSILANTPEYRSAREKRIKLGLDLQGGMYLVMEVNTAKLLERLAKDPDEQFFEILKQAEAESQLSDENVVTILARLMQEKNIRLSRYFGSIREDDAQIIARLQEQESDAVTRAIEIIRNRVDQYGVSEPNIQKQGSRRIVIELPGVAREEEAKRLLQGRALLEFKLVKDADFAIPIMNRIDEVLAKSIGIDSAQVADTTQQLTEEEFAKQHPFFAIARLADPQGRIPDAYVKESDKPKLNAYLQREEVKKVMPDNVEFLFDAKPIVGDDGEKYYRMYMVNKTPELTGGVIVDAQANIDPTTSAPVVSMQMNAEGAREWARITGSNIGKRCAIVLDGVVYSAPVIQSKIPSGNSQISGIPNLDEAKLLEIVLKAGALPAPVEIIEQRTVGPSLGQDSIRQGFNSLWLGYTLVAIFMIFYYRRAGTLADIGLIVTVLLILGVLAGFQATLTLPGIAGIVLTMGMAVDANVIIYERIREELNTGKTARAAVDAGYRNSFSAIIDSNITTFFTGIILYQFGSGPIQGFALTLMIGILTSLFSALIVVRMMFDYMLNKGQKINIG
ncbi:Preprotein translocase subunit SecD [Melioribacter roseus P3M-2]|uniref:Protein translocase subunit SecD n=1 Tax=Melioribacter roseus (strain DSM 23840 / JCM 17771 / VKM B-2668 / P3M-2) TaxID=1191523 RepID=I6Z7F8_MELRP|nr:protein translocase subunit SecD [Melioribacter roseus]AFN75095.1 Preprotein translocase subunit SecD [Melioribacter roseus P3M-2]